MPVNNVTDAETAVRRFYEPLGTGDIAVLDEALAADWEAVPALRTGPGPDGWKASITHLRGIFTDLTVTIEDIVVSGDGNTVAGTAGGRQLDSSMDEPSGATDSVSEPAAGVDGPAG